MCACIHMFVCMCDYVYMIIMWVDVLWSPVNGVNSDTPNKKKFILKYVVVPHIYLFYFTDEFQVKYGIFHENVIVWPMWRTWFSSIAYFVLRNRILTATYSISEAYENKIILLVLSIMTVFIVLPSFGFLILYYGYDSFLFLTSTDILTITE